MPTVWVDTVVLNLLPFEHQPKTVSWQFSETYHYQLSHWLEEGCHKLKVGMCEQNGENRLRREEEMPVIIDTLDWHSICCPITNHPSPWVCWFEDKTNSPRNRDRTACCATPKSVNTDWHFLFTPHGELFFVFRPTELKARMTVWLVFVFVFCFVSFLSWGDVLLSCRGVEARIIVRLLLCLDLPAGCSKYFNGIGCCCCCCCFLCVWGAGVAAVFCSLVLFYCDMIAPFEVHSLSLSYRFWLFSRNVTMVSEWWNCITCLFFVSVLVRTFLHDQLQSILSCS